MPMIVESQAAYRRIFTDGRSLGPAGHIAWAMLRPAGVPVWKSKMGGEPWLLPDGTAVDGGEGDWGFRVRMAETDRGGLFGMVSSRRPHAEVLLARQLSHDRLIPSEQRCTSTSDRASEPSLKPQATDCLCLYPHPPSYLCSLCGSTASPPRCPATSRSGRAGR